MVETTSSDESALASIRADLNLIKTLVVSSHSEEFEKIHQRLQQALTNLDGV